ncbi:MAG TPA: HAD-IA family hydrolase [Stellaceae bacterium]|jgi:HAD superfamily hydrolase (TIGR01509 family)|nr:HAD-IA family hydrolase [Stellaceae bacterium]
MIPFDLVIFDCDGVLIDSELLSIRADLACLAEDGIALSVDEILERYTGISLAGMLADLEARHGRRLPDFARRHQQRLEAIFAAELRVIPGVTAVLDQLGCLVCVASSGSPERLRHALSLVGLFERFHPNIFSASEVARGKPAPDLFLHAAQRMDVAPHRAAVVEDSLPGVAAAVAAGMTAIGFAGGSHCRPGHASRLAAAGAAIVIDRMAQLLPALERQRS